MLYADSARFQCILVCAVVALVQGVGWQHCFLQLDSGSQHILLHYWTLDHLIEELHEL